MTRAFAVLVVGSRRSKRRAAVRLSSCAVVALALTLQAARVRAVNLHANAGKKASPSIFTVDAPDLIPVDTGVVMGSYSVVDEPLVCSDRRAREAAIPYQHVLGLSAGAGFLKRLDLTATLPIGVTRANLRDNRICPGPERMQGLLGGVFDPDVRLRMRFFRDGPLVLTGAVSLRPALAAFLFPDGRSAIYSDIIGGATALVNGGVRFKEIAWMFSGGFNARFAQPLADTSVGGELLLATGVEAPIAFGFLAAAEVKASVMHTPRPHNVGGLQLPAEAMVGAKYRDGPLEIALGLGGGILPGIGAPHARGIASVSYEIGTTKERRPRSLRDLLVTQVLPPTQPPPRQQQNCPDPRSEEARLFVREGCPVIEEEQVELPDDDDEPSATLDVLDDCPQCGAKLSRVQSVVLYVYFDHDADRLSSRERELIAREVQRERSGQHLAAVLIEAHADSSGHDDYNLALSRRRSGHIAGLLNELSVPAAVVQQGAFGERDPLLPEATAEGNRRVRVELVFHDDDEEAP